MFEYERERVTGEWKKLHNEKLYDLYHTKYYSGDEIKKNEIGGECSMCGGQERCNRVLVGKPEGKGLLGRTKHRW
jgi:hypothetical protein